MPKRPPAVAEVDMTGRQRRPRGEPRRLLLAAAKDVFNRKGYAGASTREIADLAAVSETLIFRYFKSKAGLFREAVVRPFVALIDEEIERLSSRTDRAELTREDTRDFVAAMYDVFREHRALAALVFAADALVESELSASGVIDEVRAAIDRFVSYASEEARAVGKALPPASHDLAIRGHMAMVAGVATFGPWYFGKRRPSRKAVIDELTEWVYVRYNPRS
jgi:AcrR family transcriptional regulator